LGASQLGLPLLLVPTSKANELIWAKAYDLITDQNVILLFLKARAKSIGFWN